MQKAKQKRKLAKEPQAEEDFGVEEYYCDLEDINESLIDDLCYATERIESLEDELNRESRRLRFTDGVGITTLIFVVAWLISIL